MSTVDGLMRDLNETCYYRLADQLGIQVYTMPDLLDSHVCGLYLKQDESIYVLIINAAISIEHQERSVYLILEHHLKHNGIPYALTMSNLLAQEETVPPRIKAMAEFKGLLRGIMHG